VRDEFSFRSERLALDFAATLMFRGSPGAPTELLDSPGRLGQWAAEAGVLSAVVPAMPEDLASASALREAIYRSASARIAGTTSTRRDITLINRHAGGTPPAIALERYGMIVRTGRISSALAAIARDAVELLGGADAPRLRQCARNGCTRMFVDQSRGQNRSWCGMRQCGNRVNAAAYRRRQRADTPA